MNTGLSLCYHEYAHHVNLEMKDKLGQRKLGVFRGYFFQVN
jgi:hypothetical protein